MKDFLEIINLFYKSSSNRFLNAEDARKSILKNISFTVKEGEIFGITGESGSGKTTLAKIIAEMLSPTSGKINKHFQTDLDNNINPIQILFQNSDELINPLREIKSLLSDTAKSENDIIEICRLVGIKSNLFDKKGFQLSGGERQRVALGRILLASPNLLILDEPFSAQDPDSQSNLAELLKTINEKLKLTIICISHDIHILKKICNFIGVIYGGTLVEVGSINSIFDNCKHPYTKFLLTSCDYSLERSDFGSSINEVVDTKMCSYFYRCERQLKECGLEVKKNELDQHITYCNNPY